MGFDEWHEMWCMGETTESIVPVGVACRVSSCWWHTVGEQAAFVVTCCPPRFWLRCQLHNNRVHTPKCLPIIAVCKNNETGNSLLGSPGHPQGESTCRELLRGGKEGKMGKVGKSRDEPINTMQK